ncbi:MAG TPA: VOC family protein [Planctomicrobium sp.]|nr:VOC family protein [Planctomicrobium sp.]
MSKKVFINLPVKDLNKSMEFFRSLGYTFNPDFTDETAACMVISEEIYSMLITEARFQEFIPNSICDATKSTEVLVALTCDSREEVDELVTKAIHSGATTYSDPKDYGFMYYRSFQDLDGHIWELCHMDASAAQG